MSSDPYSAIVRDLFAAPVHAGEIEGGESASVSDQGVRIKFFASVDGGHISAMRFKAWGCPHLIAAAEAACAALEGQPAVSLVDWTAAELMRKLPVPVEKTGRILVIEDTVQSLGQRFCGET